MIPICIHITTELKNFFEQRRKQTGIPVAVQIRTAMENYMKTIKIDALENEIKEEQRII